MAKKISQLLLDNPITAVNMDFTEKVEMVDKLGVSGAALMSEVLAKFQTTMVLKSGDTMTGGLAINSQQGLAVGDSAVDPTAIFHVLKDATGSNNVARFTGDGTSLTPTFDRYQTNAAGPAFLARKARGSRASPANIVMNDQVGRFDWHGFVDGAFNQSASFEARVIEPTPATGAMGSDIRFSTVQNGTGTLTEAFRCHSSLGIAIRGNNYVIDQNRLIQLRVTTLSSLSTFTPAQGKMIYVSDVGGGNGTLVGDGVVWRRSQEVGTQTRATGAAFTLTPLTSAPEQYCSGTLTADRAITLSTTNVYDGATFSIVRTGAGAFNYTVAHNGGTKNIAQNQWAKFVYFTALAAWQCVASGSI